ncbi:hypothetical protein Tco_0393238 [Tanacetum coccineum]
MARQCTQPKRARNAAWFKENLMLAEAQEAGQILDEEQLAFLADPGMDEAPVAQQTIPQNSAFQTKDLDAYDSDCDDLSSAKAVLMANLSTCDFDVLSEVPYSDSYPNDMINQDVQEMSYFEQTHIDDYPDNEINKHVVISVIDNEETLILEEESRSKMFDKENDLILIEKKINIAPIDYSMLNKIKEYFGKRFVTQKELSAEQAFLLKHSNHTFVTSDASHIPVIVKAPRELPNVSLVNGSLKKLRYQLAKFEKVVKNRTTSDAITAGAWGFEHTKACFQTEIIPFIKVLKDTFNVFDKTLLDEITEVQSVFNQMEAAVDQCSVDKKDFEIQIKQLRIDNDQLLNQIMSQEIMHMAVNSVDILDVNKSSVNECCKCLELETELLKKKDFVEKDVFDKLVKSYSTLEKHCISLELATQLNQENFQKENSGANQNASLFNQLFEINKFKAQSQEKDTVITKLKEKIKSFSGKANVENVKIDIDEMETINIKLEHNLNAQLQEKVFAIAALKNELRKLKGKSVVDTAVSKPYAVIITPGMFKMNLEPLAPKLLKNKDARIDYIKHTRENADILRELEVLVYVKDTCPCLSKPSEKLVVVKPLNKDKRVRFADPITSSCNVPKQTNFLKSQDSNKALLHSTGVKCSTSASGSKPSGNTKNNRISQSSRRIFTIVGNRCPLTRITSIKIVPPKETTIAPVKTPTLELKVVQIVLWYLDSGCSKHMTGNRSQLINFVSKFLGTVRFGNDHIAKIMGYGDYQMGNVTISRVYYMEGL